MFFGISGSEFFVLLIVLVVVIGPQRLPEYTRKLTQLVRQLRVYLENAKEQIAQEVGPELADLNLEDLNPRNYDPRKIVREALGEDLDAIRRDLANPFQSVVSAAKESSGEAVAAAKDGAGKPLTQMIEDKKQEALAAKSAAAPVAAADPPAAAEGPEPVETEQAGPDQADPGEPAEPAAGPEEPTAQVDSSQDADQELDEAQGETPSVIEADEPEHHEAPEPTPVSPAVPSSLVEPVPDAQAPRVRPVSPRDIVRAARAAARTRPEAAAARLDA